MGWVGGLCLHISYHIIIELLSTINPISSINYYRNNQCSLTFGGLLIVYVIVLSDRTNTSSLYSWHCFSLYAEGLGGKLKKGFVLKKTLVWRQEVEA